MKPTDVPFLHRSAKAGAPAALLLLITTAAGLVAETLVRVEIIFAVTAVAVWVLAGKRRWDTGSLFASLSGFLIALSCPDINWAPVAFIALIPLFFALAKSEGVLESTLYGIIAGVTTILIGFSWGGRSFAGYTGLNPVAGLVMFLPFTVLLSLKLPLFAALVDLNNRRFRIAPAVLLPIAYGALEYAKIEVYPWYLGLGLSGSRNLSQLADIAGLVGLSALVVLINCLLFSATNKARNRQIKAAAVPLVLAGALLAAGDIYGRLRLRQIADADSKQVRIAVVQPNSPGKILNRDIELKQRISENLHRLALQAAQPDKPDLIVFAEASAIMGYQVGYNPEFVRAYRRIAAETSCPLLTDNVHFKRDRGELLYWRGALLLSPEGEVAGEYLKRRLVPFGEYIPFADTFPFLKGLFRYAKIYQRGTERTLLDVGGVRIAPDICFEIIHPAATREHVGRDADLIVNMSNDSWFGSHKQARQHFALARFRTIELRMPMVRATNTGISAYIDAAGNIQSPASPMDMEWTANRIVTMPHVRSLYRRFGDWFGILCVITTAGLMLFGWRNDRRRKTIEAHR